jgi:hypothetical protein
MCRRTERANLEKKPSMRLSQEPCLGVKIKSKRPAGRVSSQVSGFPRDVRGMIVEDQLDRGAGRIGGIKQLEEFDELTAAVAISTQRMDLSAEQINPGQQAERAMAFVLMIPREGGMHARHWRQIRRRGRDRLDARLLVKGDDRYRFLRLLRLGGGFLQDLDLAIDTQNFRHLVLELGVAEVPAPLPAALSIGSTDAIGRQAIKIKRHSVRVPITTALGTFALLAASVLFLRGIFSLSFISAWRDRSLPPSIDSDDAIGKHYYLTSS